MSVEDEHDRLARRLAFYGIFFGGMIALGIAFLSIGGTLIFSVVPQLYDTIEKAENNNTNLNKIQEKKITDEFKLIAWEANSSSFLMYGGGIIILLGMGGSYFYMIRGRPLLTRRTHSEVSAHSTSIPLQYSNSKDYTGKKYFDTRKRLAYHPADKMFPNVTPEPNVVNKEESKKPHGTLPKGF